MAFRAYRVRVKLGLGLAFCSICFGNIQSFSHRIVVIFIVPFRFIPRFISDLVWY